MRAFYRNWTVREGEPRTVHLARPAEAVKQVRSAHRREPSQDPPEMWCGQPSWNTRHSDSMPLEPIPEKLPDGFVWCAKCVGLAARWADVLDQLAAVLVREAGDR